MKYYGVVEVTVTDPGWIGEYLDRVNPIVERYGGRYLARTSRFEFVEGGDHPHQTTVILEFPSKDDAYSFYYSKEYEPLRKARIAGTIGRFYFVAGEDTGKR